MISRTNHANSLMLQAGSAMVLMVWLFGFVSCHLDCLRQTRPASLSGVSIASCHQTPVGTGSAANASCLSGAPSPSSTEGRSGEPGLRCCCSVDLSIPEMRAVESFPTRVCWVAALLVEDAHRTVTRTSGDHAYFREARWRDWSNTPVLSLGPTLLGHAPPLPSLFHA